MYTVTITKTAEQDLLDAAIYIAHTLSNKTAANRLLDRADAAADSLAQNPMRQPLVKDSCLSEKGLRSLPVGNYLLIYAVREKAKAVSIIRFVHSRREWGHLFQK